jgi:hypothetical protein
MRSIRALIALAIVVGLSSGCSQKDPAQKAVDAAEQALADVNEQAQKYIPGQYAELKDELDRAREALGEEKYAEAIAAASELPARAKELGESAAAARETLAAELRVDWARLTETMPGKVSALELRVTELGMAKRLPKDVERDAIDRAKSGLEIAKQAWAQATDAFTAGNLEGAVARAQESERLIAELMEMIGMAPPAQAKPAA